ncbi:uncharacterized protein EMH_0006630 [Eimeria mitis]|uniref:Uncharacterized protein n=1 Tax=Eimeria mitis TaxID=44415 RepID=U6KDN0_9EIME|nr:uncharacterized protein EMH_0006630 [Eimeria mitis]CDJ36064.1 hypothetical protein, conserved [Eimeria mitis]
MEGKGKKPLALSLPLSGKEDVSVSPRLKQEPGSSHRHSLASTGVGDPSSPFLRSPELTHVSSALPSPKAATAGATTLPQPWSPPQKPGKEVLRHGVLVSPRPAEEEPRGHLMTPAIIDAKAQGKPLPPLKEVHTSMLDEFISPYTASLIDEIPKEDMLRMAGPSIYTHDPRFTEDVKQYHLDHPVPPDGPQRFPNYENFPLLLNQVHRPTLEPNFKETKHSEHLRGHNEAMLENKWQHEGMHRNLQMRETYMHVPNFGRVQAVLTDFPDGTSYPLVTLPKMTPYDILSVLDRQQKAREMSWWNTFLRCLHKISCGFF